MRSSNAYVVFWFLLSFCPNTWKTDFWQLPKIKTYHGYCYFSVSGKLLRTFILWYTVCKCQGGYINESIHLFSIIWLFSSALTALLDRFYLTVHRFVAHIARWILFTVLSGIVLLAFPENNMQKIGLLIMASWLFIYGITLAYRLIKTYRKAVKLFDDTHSDHIGAYIHWLSIFTYWAVIYGVSCGLLTFLPDEYIYLWVISSIPFYIYLYCSYLNYQIFYEQVENILETEIISSEQIEPKRMNRK